jgi:Derlin-2/3
MGDVQAWYFNVPVVTRTYMTMAFMTTLACSLDIITPLTLYLNTHLIYTKYQVMPDAAPSCPALRARAGSRSP